ncbi:hypothetical protein PVNG_02846 [Plasmodium vivax North Korean]|uniref:Uncharacterized protein n=1 Tax=Plasmodium vivax North Korean TaxID=1035514 RepID=A0A0J9TML7_PLAVI|nr:hypothetical protein PVNG_02846 [Plasmodium vivax North Korean]
MYSDFKNALMSYAKYDIFNKHVEVDGENSKCEELSRNLRMNKSFKKFCYMLSKNIKDVCGILVLKEGTSENCEFLNYWLYDALIKINFLNDEKIESQSSLMDKISELWDESNYNKKCDLIKHNIKKTDFIHMKELYDYSKNYLAIEDNQTIHREQQCRNQYCSYIKNVDHVYELAKSACNPHNDKPYCQILGRIPEGKIPRVFLNGYNCIDDEIHEDHITDDKIFTNQLLATEFEVPDYPSVVQQTGGTFSQPIDGRIQHPSEGSSSNSSVKVGLSTFGMSLVPLFLIYKVKIHVYFIIFTFIMNQLFSIKKN